MNMRDIKFRAWDKVAKAMSPEFVLFGEFTLMGAVHSWQHHVGNTAKTSLEALDDLEIMQFTGLKDKNGKEIYEWDIIKWKFVDAGEPYDDMEYTEVVEWDECGFFLDGGAPLTVAIDDCEVIGNIYENPELLKTL